ncbi:hypothetical protein FIBSPDRAFT_187891 [Athelia psychrophila]|uniref:Uncharacterized protein n=1 Tax=Athelia psychrophila TaxID=1759441 RepID=A0A166A8X4_9AGAM|nr:hypothetical protein FIBSPDRAFT_187891 [Fibularhizoctonia sp. CBS 109695]
MTTHDLPAKLTTTDRCTSRPSTAIFFSNTAERPDHLIRDLQQHCPVRALRCRPLHRPLRHIQAFLLLSGTSPVRGTPPYPTPGSSGMSRSYGSARPPRRPVARVGPNKVVFKDASSGKNAYSLHQFGKSAVYKAIQTIYAPHYAQPPRVLSARDPRLHSWPRQGLYRPSTAKYLSFRACCRPSTLLARVSPIARSFPRSCHRWLAQVLRSFPSVVPLGDEPKSGHRCEAPSCTRRFNT